MTAILKGDIVAYVPYFTAHIESNKELVFSGIGDIYFTVDTGFSGGIALSEDLIQYMELEIAAYDTFKLANGEIVELPVYIGGVRIGDKRVETWFIPGNSLLGLEFLSNVGSILSFDLRRGSVQLAE